MTRGGRYLTIIAMLVIAVWLHLTHCSWKFPNKPSNPSPPVLATNRWIRTTYGSNDPTVSVCVGSGVFAQLGRSGSEASVWGVAVPFALVVTTVILMLRWRQVDRAARGACKQCGHQLLPTSTQCPECGCAAGRPV